jgi:CRP-like cAMP-binding protein
MRADPFQLLTESDRKLLFEGARRASYHRGEVLFGEGDIQPHLYMLRQGLVRVERNYQGRGLAVARYGPGEVLGEISFLEQQPAFGSAVAEEDVEVDVLEARHIQAMLASDSGFASRFYHSLALCLGMRLRQILPGILPSEAAGGGIGGRTRLTRTGQLTEHQLPQELTTAVDAFRTALRAVAVELKEGRVSHASAQQRVNDHCNAVVAPLGQFTQDENLLEIGMEDLLTFRDIPDLARGVGGYVLRETFSFFMQSATIAQGFEKPRGYAEDRELLERIERNEAEGDGRLGPLIDRWFLDRPLCRARRNSLLLLTAFLKEVAEAAPAPGPVRLTSLAAGTAREVFGLLAATSLPLYVTCLDGDADTLLLNANQARELGCADRITFLQADLPTIIRGKGSVSLGPQLLIYGLGVCDYLNDEQVQQLLNWIYDLLVPGGWVVLTNRDAANPDRAFTEHILDWPTIHRKPEEFGELFARSRCGRLPEIKREEAGVNLFALFRKN